MNVGRLFNGLIGGWVTDQVLRLPHLHLMESLSLDSSLQRQQYRDLKEI